MPLIPVFDRVVIVWKHKRPCVCLVDVDGHLPLDFSIVKINPPYQVICEQTSLYDALVMIDGYISSVFWLITKQHAILFIVCDEGEVILNCPSYRLSERDEVWFLASHIFSMMDHESIGALFNNHHIMIMNGHVGIQYDTLNDLVTILKCYNDQREKIHLIYNRQKDVHGVVLNTHNKLLILD